MKVVLDTNVLFAAFATHGLCEAVFDMCLGAHDIVLSEHILRELRRHLTRKLKLPEAHAEALVAFVRQHADVVRPAAMPPDACPDGSDLPVLGTAAASGADCLVTGDRALLELRRFRSIPILSPRAFHDRLR